MFIIITLLLTVLDAARNTPHILGHAAMRKAMEHAIFDSLLAVIGNGVDALRPPSTSQARRQIVPWGVSSSATPSASSSARMRSASAKFFAFLASIRAAIRASMAAESSSAPSAPPCRNAWGTCPRRPSWRFLPPTTVCCSSAARSYPKRRPATPPVSALWR